MSDTDTDTSPPDTPAAEADTPVEFHPDGTITVPIGDETYRLGRPTIGQTRRYEDLLEEHAVAAGHAERLLRATLSEAGVTLGRGGKVQLAEGTDEMAALAAIRKAKDEARKPTLQATETWWTTVLCDLAGADKATIPPMDDWPAYMTNANLMARMSRHWLMVPLAPGRTATEQATPDLSSTLANLA